MTLANKITFSRIVLAFVFIFFLFCQGLASKVTALIIFVLASLTDYYDGWLAKNRNQVSNLGKILDPIADKILVLGAFISFVQLNIIEVWMVVLIFIREFIITTLRAYALAENKVLAASRAGKQKTVSQMAAIFFILLSIIIKEYLIRASLWNASIDTIIHYSIYIVMDIAIILTLTSGLSYLWQNRKIILRS
ncbi:MAG: CDP-diacylglycerol--glycerol-3-phosphate 3-phosphatidyltransferase [Candidatus Omnitrophota bacterium]